MWALRLVFACVVFLLETLPLPATAYAQAGRRLETPAGLERDVEFWQNTFSKFSADECIFHDSWHLDMVYGVQRLPNGSRAQQERLIDRRRRAIAATLGKLARGERLSEPNEIIIGRSVPQYLRRPEFYRRAMRDVRCQRGIKDEFFKSVKRSQQYLPMIRRVLQEHGLPQDVAYLPHLESGYNIRAHSKVGARGLWQLMPSVARENSLKVNFFRDDRLDPSKSTRVAARSLVRNYQMTKSWPLALTGYNYGINGIVRGVRNLGTDDYMAFRKRHHSQIFGFAARNFYPSFLAVRNLAHRYEAKKNVEIQSQVAKSGSSKSKAKIR